MSDVAGEGNKVLRVEGDKFEIKVLSVRKGVSRTNWVNTQIEK